MWSKSRSQSTFRRAQKNASPKKFCPLDFFFSGRVGIFFAACKFLPSPKFLNHLAWIADHGSTTCLWSASPRLDCWSVFESGLIQNVWSIHLLQKIVRTKHFQQAWIADHGSVPILKPTTYNIIGLVIADRHPVCGFFHPTHNKELFQQVWVLWLFIKTVIDRQEFGLHDRGPAQTESCFAGPAAASSHRYLVNRKI